MMVMMIMMEGEGEEKDGSCTEDWSRSLQWEAIRNPNDEPLLDIVDEIIRFYGYETESRKGILPSLLRSFGCYPPG